MTRVLIILLALLSPALVCAQEDEGKALYTRMCASCHGPGLWGTNALARRLGPERSLLETRTDLSKAQVRSVARTGLGAMPSYRRSELSDAELAAIAAYLTRRR